MIAERLPRDHPAVRQLAAAGRNGPALSRDTTLLDLYVFQWGLRSIDPRLRTKLEGTASRMLLSTGSI